MFPYSLGVLTALQGLYALLFIAILLDVASPTLDLRSLPEWTGSQSVLLASREVSGIRSSCCLARTRTTWRG